MPFLYRDSGRSPEERATDLLSRMTFEEKVAQMHALWLILSEDGKHRPRNDDFTGGTDPEAVRQALGRGLGQISRALGSHGVDAKTGVRALNRLQKFLVEETRLGIPVMSHEECLVGLMARGATMFPSALAYGATWNPDLIEKAAAAIGREARSVGCHQGLAPVLDVSRDVRWGRTEETFGEDPYLIGVLGTRFVRGLQGEKRDLLATLKHFAGHSFSEGARNHAPVHLGWRELNDTFLLPFEMAVKQANAGSVMPAYHDVDNESVHASRHLLTTVLRDEWGFDGIIVADYIGISLLYQHHNLARDRAEAAALAFNAGLDIELPADDCAAHLADAVERGLISSGDDRSHRHPRPRREVQAGHLREALRRRGSHLPAGARDGAGRTRRGTAIGGGAREPGRAAHRPDEHARRRHRADRRRPARHAVRLQLPGAPDSERRGRSGGGGRHAARRVREGVRCRARQLRPGLSDHRGAEVRVTGVPGRRGEEHVAHAGVPGLHPRPT